MWEPRPLTTLWASMACYRDSFTLLVLGVEVFRAVAMKNSVFWDITPCSPLNIYRRFEGSELFVTYFMLFPSLVHSSTLKMEATCSSEISVDFQPSKRRYIA
jgi:hypothetical protein